MKADVQPVVSASMPPAKGRGNETYTALVWRRLKRSWTGMTGLILVCLLMIMTIFAEFFAPVDPKLTGVGFAPPQTISMTDRDGNFVFPPRTYPIRETDELDPVTFQPIVGPDYENPQTLGFFVKGFEYRLFGLIPAQRHFFGATDGSPVNFLGTDKFGRDVLSRIIYGSRISLMIALTVVFIVTVVGTTVGMVSGYFGGRLDAWVQALRRTGARLSATAAISGARLADPGDGADQRLSGLRHFRHVCAWLGADVARGPRQDAGAGADRLCAGGDGDRRDRPADHLPAYFSQCHEPCHRGRYAGHPQRRAA
jgi:hypothetical protein